MRRLFVAIFIMTLVVLPSCKFFKRIGLFGNKEKSLAEMLAIQDSIRVADSLRNVQEQLIAIENAKLDSIRLATEEQSVKSNQYNIIVGSFVTPEYARELSDVYRQLGYDVKILKLEGTNFEMVAAESHESFSRAVKRLDAFQDTVDIDAWLYIIK